MANFTAIVIIDKHDDPVITKNLLEKLKSKDIKYKTYSKFGIRKTWRIYK